MLPYIQLNFIHQTVAIHSSWITAVVALMICLSVLIYQLTGKVPAWKIIVLSIFFPVMAIIGARMGHLLLFAQQEFTDQDNFFTNPGLSSFSGVLLCYLAFNLLPSILLSPQIKIKLSDSLALLMPLCYGILRIGCFLSGCCWGKITFSLLAIKFFHPQAIMPLQGFPVHPFQLYDAVIGFLIFFYLIYLFQKNHNSGKLIHLFFTLFGAARFMTDFFRHQANRGPLIIYDLSLNQLFALFVLLIGCYNLRNSFNLSKIFQVKAASIPRFFSTFIFSLIGMTFLWGNGVTADPFIGLQS